MSCYKAQGEYIHKWEETVFSLFPPPPRPHPAVIGVDGFQSVCSLFLLTDWGSARPWDRATGLFLIWDSLFHSEKTLATYFFFGFSCKLGIDDFMSPCKPTPSGGES